MGNYGNLGMQSKVVAPIRIQTLEMYQITKVAAGFFSAALTSQHELLLWGQGEFGSFVSPQKIYMEDVRFCDVAVNKNQDGTFGCAIDTDGFLYTWGLNQFG